MSFELGVAPRRLDGAVSRGDTRPAPPKGYRPPMLVLRPGQPTCSAAALAAVPAFQALLRVLVAVALAREEVFLA
ncbi:MAG: hypothetical protein WCG47_33345, partial [Dermatophilaceae bacterium]